MPTSDAELHSIRTSVAWVGRLSDGLVHIGPFSLGLDGVLSWVPGLGDLYSAAAGGFLIWQGARAEVPAPVLAAATLLIACRTLVGSVPIAGSAFADVFTAHKWAAAMIVRAIDRRLGAAIYAEAWDPSARAKPRLRRSSGLAQGRAAGGAPSKALLLRQAIGGP